MKIKTGARFRHDCENDCIYVGPYENFDLYVHQNSHNEAETVIARYGSDGPDYSSLPKIVGLATIFQFMRSSNSDQKALGEGWKRAEMLGLLGKN